MPGEGIHYKDLLSKGVCDMENRNCMLRGCEKCPGDKAIRQLVESRFDIDNDDDENEDSVKYRQWIKNEDGKKI